MSYGEDCYEAIEARRKADGVEHDVYELERDLRRLRCDYDEAVAELRADIRELWAALADVRTDVGP